MLALLPITEFTDDKLLYVHLDPQINDFTKKYNGNIIITSSTKTRIIPITDIPLNSLYHSLWRSIFNAGRTIFTWDIKKFISYLRYHLKTSVNQPGSIVIDLKYGMAYLGHRIDKPLESFIDVLQQARMLSTSPGWQNVRRYCHNPLSFKVLPEIEIKPIICDNQALYSCYEIEGQANGRLLSWKASDRFITVHSLTPQQKSVITPIFEDDNSLFIIMDYQHMEVSMLAWLAGDEALAAALGKPDFYESVAPLNCDPQDRRKIGKAAFLPVIYGLQSKNLAERLKLEPAVVDKLTSELHSRFSKSFQWIEQKQAELATNPVAVDHFGRKRDFANEPSYKRRNFEVQSPASFVCL